MDISIHAPACGERQRNRIENFKNITFLSTLPMRGATAFADPIIRKVTIFLSTLPQGERPMHNWESGVQGM